MHKKGRDVRDTVSFTGRSYRNFNKETFNEALLKLDWEYFYSILDPEEAWSYIISNTETILDGMCPLREFRIKNYRPDWMTDELIEQTKDRDYFYHKAKLTGDVDAWNIAKFLRNVTNSNIRQAKRDFVLEELKQNERNPRKFWKVIRGVIPSDKSTDKKDILLKDNGKKLKKEDVAHFINDYFINVGKVSTRGDPNASVPSLSNVTTGMQVELPSLDKGVGANDLNKVSKFEVLSVVKEINISKSSGLDNISSFIVKVLFTALLVQVTYMFNLSIGTATFPNPWKSALVIPIPKSGDLTNVKNFRPISLLPLPGKILEKLVHKQLSGYLEGESLLISDQHGFRKNHSTIHSVAQVINYVNTKLDSKMCTLATYVDFRKAFDCVQHPVLIDKLKSLNFEETVINWVKSYLTGREQKVLANGTYSTPLPITQGVPQGSVLGPLFYIIYANDLSKVVKNCKIALYADDTVLYTADESFDKSITNMQGDLDALSTWCSNNGIRANTEKSKVMVFGSTSNLSRLPQFELTLEKTPLQTVNNYKYLGIILDQQLNYNLHVNKIISSVAGKLKQFQRMRSFLSVKAAILVYKGTILPLLEYGDLFLNATTLCNRKRMPVLQNKCLRCALNKGMESSSDDLHAEAKLLKLKYRREEHLLNFMYDWAQDARKLKSKRGRGVTTRSCSKPLLKIKKPSTEKFKKSLSYYGPKKWNGLNENLQKATSKGNFKSLSRDWVLKKAARAIKQASKWK